MWFLLLACMKVPDTTELARPQPRVPTPQSMVYVHVDTRPTDVLVARAWPAAVDESLSGAAGAVAFKVLRSGSTSAADVRWRAILAGYPWPIERAELARVAENELPEALLTIAAPYAGKDVGLVRVREAGTDQWVLLVGGRRGDLKAFPREPARGSTLLFPGHAVLATAPSGTLLRADERLTVDEPGEWLVTLSDSEGEVATFPLYVDRPTPQAAPLRGPATAESNGDLNDELLNRLDDLDEWYDRAAPDREAALDGVARVRLREFVARRPLPATGPQLAAVGYFAGAAGECRAATIVDCLDTMWWSHSGHAALAREWAAVGLAVEPTPEGVAISITVAAALPPTSR